MAKSKTQTAPPPVPTRAPGRPPGTPNKQADHVRVSLPRCIRCKSTERSDYTRREEQEFAGLDEQGNPYTHIIRRWCRCVCGQARIERSYECRAVPETDEKAKDIGNTNIQ